MLQGEAETVMSPGVKSLGRFHLMGIAPAPRGMPQIEVAFDIDANGIVNVSAKDLATGKEQAMTITGGTALSKDEVERMVQDAEKFAAEDHERREAAEARNQADQLAYQVDEVRHGERRQGPRGRQGRADHGERRAEGGPEGRGRRGREARPRRPRPRCRCSSGSGRRCTRASRRAGQRRRRGRGRRRRRWRAGRDRVRGRRRRGRDRRRRGCIVTWPPRR